MHFATITTVLAIVSLLGIGGEALPTAESPPPKVPFIWQAMEGITGVPWSYLVAMNQVEKGMRGRPPAGPDKPPNRDAHLAISVPSRLWSGWMNPEPESKAPLAFQLFGGIGRDANGDGRADKEDPVDILYSVAKFLGKEGTDGKALESKLREYYNGKEAARHIIKIAKVYEHAGTTELETYRFPVPFCRDRNFSDNWGLPRGWGGRGSHEGTDIAAPYGAAVVSPCYGYVEELGWSYFGGWVVGIRDTNNWYHYLAHLSHYRKGLREGDIVQPGERLGAVGSSGYGRPGTQGKLPPHLHYGVYWYNGRATYAVNPYGWLRKWQRAEQPSKGRKARAAIDD